MHVRSKGKNPSQDTRTRDVDFNYRLIPLGVAMEIPDGYEAILVPRSSVFKDWGFVQTNSEGIIDGSYAGEKDEWKLPVLATRTVTIPKGTRIAQFRIQLKQQASCWQKLKWLFSSKVELKRVDHLDKPSRGGIGEGTGK
jgi:dUTP pyrophosphatase